MAWTILYVDRDLIVVDKPSGLLTAPGLGPANADNLASRVQVDYPDARLVHRLDRDTSGIVLFARGMANERELSLQFQRRGVRKLYTAIVLGQTAASSGRIELPLRKDLDRPPRQCVDHAQGKPAITDWRVVERQPDRTRLDLAPLTGRSHQLRVHLEAIGHPILGDGLYGTDRSREMSERLLLHASRLQVRHPTTGESIVWQSEARF